MQAASVRLRCLLRAAQLWNRALHHSSLQHAVTASSTRQRLAQALPGARHTSAAALAQLCA